MSKKKVLVTAGKTRIPIDQVRSIDNIFKGKTGANIAEYFAEQGCDVTILTSSPHLITPCCCLKVVPFETYDDLFGTMKRLIQEESFDIVIHSAAVSDYQVDGMYHQTGSRRESDGRYLRELEKLDSSGKISSNYPELWMRLVPTVKIIDQIREPWGFKGIIVKFKLQVGMDDEKLIRVAINSMKHSKADFIVANTLEDFIFKAFIVSANGGEPVCVSRDNLPAILYREIGL